MRKICNHLFYRNDYKGTLIRLIPLETVDNNRGPDRLAGQKAKFQSLRLNLSCACLGPWHVHYSLYYCRTSDIAAVDTIFKVFRYDAVWAEHRIHHPPNSDQICYTLCYGRGVDRQIDRQIQKDIKRITQVYLMHLKKNERIKRKQIKTRRTLVP